MYKTIRTALLLASLGCSVTSQAQSVTMEYWTCQASDSMGRNFAYSARNQGDSMNGAVEICKKSSTATVSCRSNPQRCSLENIQKLWRCTAFDENGGHWRGEFSTSQSRAVASSMRNCHALSFTPMTCTVHYIACVVRDHTG